jgi:hypothetical protein
LWFKPGKLTQEFVAGRRASYLPPFRLYLVLSIIFFLAASLSNTHVKVLQFDSKTGGMSQPECDNVLAAAAQICGTPAVLPARACIFLFGDDLGGVGGGRRRGLAGLEFRGEPDGARDVDLAGLHRHCHAAGIRQGVDERSGQGIGTFRGVYGRIEHHSGGVFVYAMLQM